MKRVIQHPELGEIIYEESFWTGKKKLSINGEQLISKSRNVFETSDGKTVTLKGNIINGTKAEIDGNTVEISPSTKWYEYVLSFISFAFVLVWGNVPSLCAIFPIVGGAIGGFISALISMLNIYLIKKTDKIWLKVVISLASFVVAVLICYLLALAILSAL